MNDPDFINGFFHSYEELRRLMTQPVLLNNTRVGAVVDMQSEETVIVKGGLEEQRMVTVIVWRDDFNAAIAATPTNKQILVTIESDEILLVNDIRNNRLLPYIELQCVRFRK